MEGFEQFRRTRGEVRHEPLVRLNRSGTFHVNEAAHTLLGHPAAVQLFYHPKKKVIALRPVERGTPDSFVLRPSGKGYVLAGKRFCQYFGIPLEKPATTYRARKGDSEVVLTREDEES